MTASHALSHLSYSPNVLFRAHQEYRSPRRLSRATQTVVRRFPLLTERRRVWHNTMDIMSLTRIEQTQHIACRERNLHAHISNTNFGQTQDILDDPLPLHASHHVFHDDAPLETRALRHGPQGSPLGLRAIWGQLCQNASRLLALT